MKLEKKSDGKYGGVGGQGIISGSHKNTLYIYISQYKKLITTNYPNKRKCFKIFMGTASAVHRSSKLRCLKRLW